MCTNMEFYLFIYLGFYVAFNTVQVISRRVVGWPIKLTLQKHAGAYDISNMKYSILV